MGNAKTIEQVNIMHDGGRILADILKDLRSMLKVGLDVMELEERFIKLCKDNNVTPSCKGYQTSNLPPFPTGLCISINDQAVHCYPEKGIILRNGDTIAIDTVIKHKDLHTDSAFTAIVGEADEKTERFLAITQMASMAGIKEAKVGNHIGDISYAIETIMQLAGFDVLRDFVGHGIGSKMHEPPDIPCYGKKGQGTLIEKGMTLAIETLACEGHPEIDYPGPNAWQTRMEDGKRFAIFEHTIAVIDNGPLILTR